jgi:hypothetical protein
VTVEHAVQDYDAWRPVFDEHGSSRREHGCTSERVHRAVDHPRAICIVMTSPSAENEQAFMTDPSLAEAMDRAGVTAPPAMHVADAE